MIVYTGTGKGMELNRNSISIWNMRSPQNMQVFLVLILFSKDAFH